MPKASTAKKTFAQLQKHLQENPHLVHNITDKPRTLVYLTGMSLDEEELAKIDGVEVYEERFLFVIGLLRNVETRIVFVTSQDIDSQIIDYYFTLFSRTESERKDMAKRWHMVTLPKAKSSQTKTMAQRLLASAAYRKRVAEHVSNPDEAVLRCFNSTEDEERLAELFQIPLNAPAAEHRVLGSKSGARSIFKAAKLTPAYGEEHIESMPQLISAIKAIRKKNKRCTRIITKFNYSFSGVGNAVIDLAGAPDEKASNAKFAAYIRKHLQPTEHDLSAKEYLDKLFRHGGVVEQWLDGKTVYSPSAQVTVQPNGKVRIVSTHEQVVDEATKQMYLGARFPARIGFRSEVIRQARLIGKELANRGIIGPFSVDFMAIKKTKNYTVYPVEINLRKGGTTHPFHIARLVTEGVYKTSGTLRSATNHQKVFYYAMDNVKSPAYVGIEPKEMIAALEESGLAFDKTTGIGITLHLMGALSQYGKFGVVCIARSPKAAEQLFLLFSKFLESYARMHFVNGNQAGIKAPDHGLLPASPEVQQKRLVQTFLQLVKIDSPSGSEAELAKHLVKQLASVGVKARIDKAGNVIAKKAGVGEGKTYDPYILSAHMDTVQPGEGVKPVVRGNVIMSDGNTILGADNKAGIAYVLEALQLLHDHSMEHRPLEIIFTTGEEQFSSGAQALDMSKITAPVGVVIDGADAGHIDITAPYIAVMNIEVTGRAAHSGVEPEKGINALKIASSAIHHMPLGRIDSETTANIGMLSSGTNRNSVPSHASLVGEVRSLSKRKLEEQLERLHKALEDAAEEHDGLLAIDTRVAVEGYQLSESDSDVIRIAETMKQVGLQPVMRKAGGGSDSNVFIPRGIKAIDIGTGVQKPHTLEEHIHIDDMVLVTQAVTALISI